MIPHENYDPQFLKCVFQFKYNQDINSKNKLKKVGIESEPPLGT